MKLKALVITALFLAGVAASVAVAKGPPEGKGNGKEKHATTASTGSTTGTTGTNADDDKHSAKKLWVCHRTGNGRYVKIRVNKKAWPAHRRHGDVLPTTGAGGSTTSTSTSASTGSTTTSGKKDKDKKDKQNPAGCPAAGSGGTTSTGTTTTAP